MTKDLEEIDFELATKCTVCAGEGYVLVTGKTGVTWENPCRMCEGSGLQRDADKNIATWTKNRR